MHISLTMFVLTFPWGHKEEGRRCKLPFPLCLAGKFSTRFKWRTCGPKVQQSKADEALCKWSSRQPHYYKLHSQVYKFDALCISGLPSKRHALRDVKFRPEMSSSGCSRFLFPSPRVLKAAAGVVTRAFHWANVKKCISLSNTHHSSRTRGAGRIFGPEIFINVSVIAADKGQKLKNNILGGYLCMCCVCEREFRIRCGEMVRAEETNSLSIQCEYPGAGKYSQQRGTLKLLMFKSCDTVSLCARYFRFVTFWINSGREIIT